MPAVARIARATLVLFMEFLLRLRKRKSLRSVTLESGAVN
jgi:hypothetical protein